MTAPTRKIKDATTVIGMLERGQVAADLSTVLTDTLRILKEQSDQRPKAKIKGKVALTLNIVVEEGAVQIEAAIENKVPKPVRSTSFYWVTEDGALSTEHPQQADMFSGPRAAAGNG